MSLIKAAGSKRFKACMLLLLVLSVTMSALFSTNVSYAKSNDKKTESAEKETGTEGSWRAGSSQSIYTDKDGKTDAKKLDKDLKDQDEPGTLAGLIIGLIVDIGDWFGDLFKKLGMSFNQIILGRINGGGVMANGKRVALYTYELSDGNPYGIVSMAVYNIIRGVIYILIACVVMARFVHAMYIGNMSKSMAAFKESISGMVLGLVLLTLMPYILDVALYIRDLMLYGIAKKSNDLFSLGLSDLDISKWFAKVAEKSFMNAFMYIASFVLVLYFAVQYIGVALSFTVSIIAFPFVCFNMQFDKNALQTWCKQVMSYALIPVVDCCLLLIPAVVGLMADTLPIKVVQFLVCTMLLPARAVLRSAMGVQGNTGMDFAGYMTLMGTAKLASAAVGSTIGSVMNGGRAFKDNWNAANEDMEHANMYADMANAEKGIMPDMSVNMSPTMGQRLGGIASRLRGASGTEKEPFTGQVLSSGGYSGSEDFSENAAVVSDDGMTSDNAVNNPQFSEFGTGGVPEADGSVEDNVAVGNVGRSTGNTGEPGGVESVNSSQDIALQAVLRKYADKDNFENSEFKGLSNERKAELYRERAKERKRNAFAYGIGNTVGGMAGGMAGAVAGGTASMFLSPGASGIITGVAMNIGSNLGAKAVGGVADMAFAGAASLWGTPENNVETGNTSFDDTVNVESYGLSAGMGGMAGVVTPVNTAYGESDEGEFTSLSAGYSDFAYMKHDFETSNDGVARQTLYNVCNYGSNAESYSKLNELYETMKDTNASYYDFRREGSEILSRQYAADFKKADYKSCGDKSYDNAIISASQKTVCRNLDPVDENNKQIPVAVNHPLSKENCASQGWIFDK